MRTDTDDDGRAETILDLPNTDGGAPRSLAVIIMRRMPAGTPRPWHWFGQRH